MDRLPALIVLAALLGACDDKKGDATAPPSRVDVSKVGAQKGATVEAFCDVYTPGDRGPMFAWPALDGEAPGRTGRGWRWVNVWATWCKPCIEEMLRLLAWREQLVTSGRALDVQFVSTDETAEAVTTFRQEHPTTPPSVRLADPAARAAWWKELGLDGDPPIPIHIFVAPSGHVRCVRAGGIRDQDRAIVERLLAE